MSLTQAPAPARRVAAAEALAGSILVVDKPSGPSSFAVLRRVRRALAEAWGWDVVRRVRMGHGGTLDPLATGVLPVLIGRATRLAGTLLAGDKAYEAEVRFGVETDTLDAEGRVVAEHDARGIDRAAIEAVLPAFRGAIVQVPPMHSALKHKGRPLYAYARAGIAVERAPRAVTVHALDLLAVEPPDARLGIRCSKGTYVRALAADLGRALRVGAHLRALRRTAAGPLALRDAVTLDALEAMVRAGADLPFLPLDAVAGLAREPAGRDAAEV